MLSDFVKCWTCGDGYNKYHGPCKSCCPDGFYHPWDYAWLIQYNCQGAVYTKFGHQPSGAVGLLDSLPKPLKHCVVMHCTNTNHPETGGQFIGDLCAPCFEYVNKGIGTHSQAYRNAALFVVHFLEDNVSELKRFIGV